MHVAPRHGSPQAQLLLQAAYETRYGIFNHLAADVGAKRPLALIAHQPNEETTKGSSLYERIEAYAESKVLLHFGLNLVQFLELPREIVENLLMLSRKYNTTTEAQAQNQLDAMGLGGQGGLGKLGKR